MIPRDFEDAWQEYAPFQYGFSKEEAACLWSLASLTPGEHSLALEIGSMVGGSACLLAGATQGQVLCVDPMPNDDYYNLFVRNVSALRVRLIRQPDFEVWPGYLGLSCDLMLLDHDHSYESTVASLVNWRRHLRGFALVFVHDYGNPNHPHVQPAVDSLPELELLGRCQSLVWGRWRF